MQQFNPYIEDEENMDLVLEDEYEQEYETDDLEESDDANDDMGYGEEEEEL